MPLVLGDTPTPTKTNDDATVPEASARGLRLSLGDRLESTPTVSPDVTAAPAAPLDLALGDVLVEDTAGFQDAAPQVVPTFSLGAAFPSPPPQSDPEQDPESTPEPAPDVPPAPDILPAPVPAPKAVAAAPLAVDSLRRVGDGMGVAARRLDAPPSATAPAAPPPALPT
ncbi:MAG: hypothetical protein VR70_09675, partial [Rhodospirillaceae bacterium BRH_c57]